MSWHQDQIATTTPAPSTADTSIVKLLNALPRFCHSAGDYVGASGFRLNFQSWVSFTANKKGFDSCFCIKPAGPLVTQACALSTLYALNNILSNSSIIQLFANIGHTVAVPVLFLSSLCRLVFRNARCRSLQLVTLNFLQLPILSQTLQT